MRAAGQHPDAIRAFASAYERLERGDAGLLGDAELEPVGELPGLERLPDADPGLLDRLALVKLNGGLATTMGLRRPKSLVEAREGRSFLDIVIGQTIALRRRYQARLPLLLMNSEATRTHTLAALEGHPGLAGDLPADFLQSMVPKLDAADHAPISWPADPALEWCPPGHGDVYGALCRSGLLAALLERGYQHAMISNSDNLGATLDPRILGLAARDQIPLLMEVVAGTEADRKGGHIARRRRDGRIVLRETVQTPPADRESFGDFRRWRYYNTNTLWVDLRALADVLGRHAGTLELPLIVNRKTVDPRDRDSPAVLQLESAMGAAIGVFESAGALVVPRTRFAPVKTTDDLLVLRSDLYVSTPELLIEPTRAGELPFVALDPRYYGLLEDFESRFPAGAPSLIEAERLVVKGDVTFGAGVVVRGTVELEVDSPTQIAPGTVLG
jgi:UTP--glucose-1-phosphate uridylyltransferase